MTPDPLHQQKLEYACFTVFSFLHQQLQLQNLSAMEFLSMTEQLPVNPKAMKHYQQWLKC